MVRAWDMDVKFMSVKDYMRACLRTAKLCSGNRYWSQSQPCSIHGDRVDVDGMITLDIVNADRLYKTWQHMFLLGRIRVPKMTEVHRLYGLKKKSVDLARFINKFVPINDAQYSFWTMRSGCTAIKNLQVGRILKALEAYGPANYYNVRKFHNEIMNPQPFIAYRLCCVKKWNRILRWKIQDYLERSNPNIRSKDAGPNFGRFLTFNIGDELTNDKMDRINYWMVDQGAKKFAEDRGSYRWTWRLIHAILADDLLGATFSEDLWTLITQWYEQAADAVQSYVDIECANILKEYPKNWRDWNIIVVEPSRVLGCTVGLRDSCDVNKVKIDLANGELEPSSIIVEAGEDRQRIVVRDILAAMSIIPNPELHKLTIRYTNDLYVGDVNHWVDCLQAPYGSDAVNCDAEVGACIGTIAIKIGNWFTQSLHSGTPTTSSDDFTKIIQLFTYLGFLQDIQYGLGDDIGFKNDVIELLLKKLKKLFRPAYELFKAKQTMKLNEKRHINFNLGVTTVWDYDEPVAYWRALKTLSTKQSPVGFNTFELEKIDVKNVPVEYSYVEPRTDWFNNHIHSTNFDELSEHIGWMFQGEDIGHFDRLKNMNFDTFVKTNNLQEWVGSGNFDLPESLMYAFGGMSK